MQLAGICIVFKAKKDQPEDNDSPTRPSPRAKRFEHAFLSCLCLWFLSGSIVGHHVHWTTLISSLWHAERRRSHPKTRRLRRRNADAAQGAPQEMCVALWIEVVNMYWFCHKKNEDHNSEHDIWFVSLILYFLYARPTKTNLTTTILRHDPRLEPKGSIMRFCRVCAFGFYPAALLAIMCTGRLSSRPFDMQSGVEVIRRRGGWEEETQIRHKGRHKKCV